MHYLQNRMQVVLCLIRERVQVASAAEAAGADAGRAAGAEKAVTADAHALRERKRPMKNMTFPRDERNI